MSKPIRDSDTLKASVPPGTKRVMLAIPMKRRDLPKNDNAAFLTPVHGGLALVRRREDAPSGFEAMHPDGVWCIIPKPKKAKP